MKEKTSLQLAGCKEHRDKVKLEIIPLPDSIYKEFIYRNLAAVHQGLCFLFVLSHHTNPIKRIKLMIEVQISPVLSRS